MDKRPSPDVVGVLLAGGQASRMGGLDKCLEEIGGRPLLAHAIERFRPQVAALVLNANGDPERFKPFGLPVVPDTVEGFKGPLAGILAGMVWARRHASGTRLVATAATDTPFFPRDLVSRLTSAIDSGKGIAIARSGGRDYPVFGLFPVCLADDLARFLAASPTLAVRDWVKAHSWCAVEFDAGESEGLDPFFNINTQDALARARSAHFSEKLRKN